MKKLLLIGLGIFSGLLLFAQEIEQKADGKYYQSGKLFTGEHKSYNEDAQLSSVRNFKKGKEDGLSIYYFSNGKKMEQRAYRDGFKDGNWLTWNLKGQKTAEANYVNDLKHGKWMVFDDKGNKRYEMHYDHGKKVGTWLMWDENRKLTSEKKF